MKFLCQLIQKLQPEQMDRQTHTHTHDENIITSAACAGGNNLLRREHGYGFLYSNITNLLCHQRPKYLMPNLLNMFYFSVLKWSKLCWSRCRKVDFIMSWWHLVLHHVHGKINCSDYQEWDKLWRNHNRTDSIDKVMVRLRDEKHCLPIYLLSKCFFLTINKHF